jgi:hypothetical protein
MLRLRRKTAMAALGAAIVGSIAIVTPAQAAQIGSGIVENNSSWGAGWDECRKWHPATHSIRRSDEGWSTPDANYYGWYCYNSTDAT